jgi:exopolysaccharide biosynthesis polyprenyl glycosylphosphotransferase
MAVVLALLDACLLFAVAWGISLRAADAGTVAPDAAAVHALAFSLCGVTAFYYHDLYDLRRVRSFGQAVQRMPRAAAAAAVLAVMVGAALDGVTAVPGWWLVGCLLAVGPVLAARAATYHLLERPRGLERVLLIGAGSLAHELVEEIQARPDLRQTLVGLVENGARVSLPGCPWLGPLDDLGRVVAEVRPHRVIVALSSRRGRMPFKALLDMKVRGIVVQDGVEVYERLSGKVPIHSLTPTSVIFGKEFKAFRLDLRLARIVIVPAAAASLLLLTPLFALIAIAIKLESPGPVLFVQERVGYKGRIFRLVKFRTMRPVFGATSEWERDNRSRLTRVGRWLRRFRLDELPQLLNVLKGDMNLVGPRPHPATNVPMFAKAMRNTPECGAQIPYYTVRSMVRPGLTGWAQVRYHYANDLKEEIEKMRYDLYYIKHRSAWLDIRILFETIRVVLRGPELAMPGRRDESVATLVVAPAVNETVSLPARGARRQWRGRSPGAER